mmetsp:Transcript_18760/g.48854  ORF Transcript_18760/g.48854 Transcript_18760/m.48854 type:complete len:268 (+) Transcript_18760:609-1412(+)
MLEPSLDNLLRNKIDLVEHQHQTLVRPGRQHLLLDATAAAALGVTCIQHLKEHVGRLDYLAKLFVESLPGRLWQPGWPCTVLIVCRSGSRLFFVFKGIPSGGCVRLQLGEAAGGLSSLASFALGRGKPPLLLLARLLPGSPLLLLSNEGLLEGEEIRDPRVLLLLAIQLVDLVDLPLLTAGLFDLPFDHILDPKPGALALCLSILRLHDADPAAATSSDDGEWRDGLLPCNAHVRQQPKRGERVGRYGRLVGPFSSRRSGALCVCRD